MRSAATAMRRLAALNCTYASPALSAPIPAKTATQAASMGRIHLHVRALPIRLDLRLFRRSCCSTCTSTDHPPLCREKSPRKRKPRRMDNCGVAVHAWRHSVSVDAIASVTLLRKKGCPPRCISGWFPEGAGAWHTPPTSERSVSTLSIPQSSSCPSCDYLGRTEDDVFVSRGKIINRAYWRWRAP